MITENIEKILDLKVKLLNFLSTDLLENEIRKAHTIFTLEGQISDLVGVNGFNDWIIHDYLFENKYNLIDIYKANHSIDEDLYNVFNNSKISYFVVVKTASGFILKDIFDKSDYSILNDELLDETGIIFARIYKNGNQYYYVDEMTVFHGGYKDHLIKGIMGKFNESKDLIGYLNIDEFIDRNSFLLYAFANIVDELVNAADEVENYDIYEAVYIIENRSSVDKVLKGSEGIRIIAADEGIYQLIDDGVVLGEIIDLKSKLEFDFITAEALERGKVIIEILFENTLIHLTDQVVVVEDLL
ncbi:MAG: hypothetical protein JW702_11475 [Clostridiales bacterium]|nr:hypothetical protein [Clostridiales bacterium]